MLNGKNPEALNNIRAQFGDNPYELKNILKYWVRTKDGQAVIPTDSIVVKIDKEAVLKDYIVKFELNDTTYELPFSADVNSSTVLKQCAEQWVEDYVNQTIKSGMVQWRILSVREDEK